MAQIKLKQIKGLTPGSILFLNQSSTVVEDFSKLNWNSTQNQLTIGGSVKFDTGVTFSSPVTQGELRWDEDDFTLELGLLNNVSLQIGEETLFRVKNQTGSTITKGTVVAFGGALGNSGVLLIEPAQSSMNPRNIMGVVTSDIITGGDGYVTHFGKIRPLDATGGLENWQEGDLLWLSPTTPGKLTNIKPTASNTKISIAAVINNTTDGLIFVRPTFSGKIDDIDNVDITGISNGDILQWDTDKFTPFTPNYITSLAHNHGVANSAGTQQFTFGVDENIRFATSGSASVAFASATKTITISSTDTNTTYTNGSGLLLTGTQFSVNPTIAGNGLTFSSGVINVNVNTDSLEIVNDIIRLKDSITGNRTFSNNVIISGDLTVNGTTTTVNTQEVDVFDNIITLAKNNTGSWVDAGIKIDRGASTHARLTWNETSDLWTAGLSGSQVPILLNAGTGLLKTGATVSINTSGFTGTLAGLGLTANGSAIDVNVRNGLSINTDYVELGGNLIKDTEINGISTHSFNFKNINNFEITSLSLAFSTGTGVYKSGDGKGLTYDLNYHSTYVNRSLVDKEYVDLLVSSATASTTYTAGTGLTLSSNEFSLTGQALALHNLSTNGIIVRTGAGVVVTRTITESTGISVSNGNGVSGNPTITNTDRGSSQNIFKNISDVNGVVQFSASSNNDEIRFEGGGATTVAFGANNTVRITSVNNTYVGSTSIILNSNSFERAALTGDVTATQNSNATTINTNAVSNDKFRQSAAFSVVGKTATGTGNVADIVAGTDGVLRRSGTGNLEFGTLVTNNIGNSQVTNAKLADMSANTIKGRISTNGVTQDLTATQVRTILNVADGADNYGEWIVANGSGAGQFSVLSGQKVLFKEGPNVTISFDPPSNTISFESTNNTYVGSTSIILNSNSFERAALTGDVTATQNSNATTIANNAVSNTKFRQSAGFSVVGKSTTGTGNVADIVAGNNGVLRRSGTGNLEFGTIVTNNIGDGQVTYSKIQNVTSNRLLGRYNSTNGSIQEITIGSGLTMSSSGVLTSDSSGFAHQNVLFVDPNGNDATAELGRIDLPWQTIKGAFDEFNTLGDGSSYTIIVRAGEYTVSTAITILNNGFISLILEGGVRINFTDTDAFIIDASVNTGVTRNLHFSISSTVRGTKESFYINGSGLWSLSGTNMFNIITDKSVNTGLMHIILSINNISIKNGGEQPIINMSGKNTDDIDIKVRIENSLLSSNTINGQSSLIHFDYDDPTTNKLSLNVINSILDSTGPHIDLTANSRSHRFGLSNNTFIYRGTNTSSYILTSSKTQGTFNNNLFYSEKPFENYLWWDFVNGGSMVCLGHQLGNLKPSILFGVTVINSGGVLEASDVFDPREYMSEWL
jgi:hypothetical protein